MFNKNQSQKTISDYDKLVDLFEERLWIAEPHSEAPWITVLTFFNAMNSNYKEDYSYPFTLSLDSSSTFEEMRDACKRYAQNMRDYDQGEPYDPEKGPTVFMMAADELDSCVVELEREIAKKNKVVSRDQTR